MFNVKFIQMCYNVLVLCERLGFLALNFIKCTTCPAKPGKFHLSTEPTFLPNTCYALVHLFLISFIVCFAFLFLCKLLNFYNLALVVFSCPQADVCPKCVFCFWKFKICVFLSRKGLQFSQYNIFVPISKSTPSPPPSPV